MLSTTTRPLTTDRKKNLLYDAFVDFKQADSYFDFARRITLWMDKIFGYETKKVMFIRGNKFIEYPDPDYPEE